MLPRHLLIALASALVATSLPLNINLGAYSPALVVGDGEISFNSPEKASQVLQTLATGAQNGAVAAGTAAQAPSVAAAVPQTASAAEVDGPGISSPLVSSVPQSSETANQTPNTNTVEAQPATVTPPDFISHKIGSGFDPLKKFPNMMKRNVADVSEQDVAKLRIKRDIDGFREALNFARDALRNQPKIGIGGGEAGVGIIVNAGENVPVNSAANGAKPPGQTVSRRAAPETPGEQNKLGMTLIAIGEI